jgi:hydrogenase maturation factor
MVDTKVTAKVVELDKANRMVTFFTESKDFVTVRFPTKVHNFDQIKVGDYLVVHYTVAAAARINPAVKDGIRETVESTTTATAPKGAMPGVATKNNVEVLANIQSFDINARTVTIKGATRTVTITVPDAVDMSKLQVGDQVQAEFSDAVAIDFQRAPAANK